MDAQISETNRPAAEQDRERVTELEQLVDELKVSLAPRLPGQLVLG